MRRAAIPWILLALLCGCSSSPDKPAEQAPVEGEGEGSGGCIDGEVQACTCPNGSQVAQDCSGGRWLACPCSGGEGEGQAEGEGEGQAEGEGEGEGGGEGGEQPDAGGGDRPDVGDWSGYRTLPLACGSIPSQVVTPAPLVVTATVVLGGDWCSAQLEAGNCGDRQIFVKAVPNPDGPRDCGAGVFRRSLSISIPDLAVGNWTVSMRGLNSLLLRKTVEVLPQGSPEPAATPSCEGERVGFVGSCGTDLTCPAGVTCQVDGTCSDQGPPQPIGGRYPVQFANLVKTCSDRDVQPIVEYDNPLVLTTVTLIVTPDPANAAIGKVTFADDPLLSNMEMPIAIAGSHFTATGTAQYVASEALNCTRSYSMLALQGDCSAAGAAGQISLANRELQCGRSEHSLHCEAAADFTPAQAAPPPQQ